MCFSIQKIGYFRRLADISASIPSTRYRRINWIPSLSREPSPSTANLLIGYFTRPIPTGEYKNKTNHPFDDLKSFIRRINNPSSSTFKLVIFVIVATDIVYNFSFRRGIKTVRIKNSDSKISLYRVTCSSSRSRKKSCICEKSLRMPWTEFVISFLNSPSGHVSNR